MLFRSMAVLMAVDTAVPPVAEMAAAARAAAVRVEEARARSEERRVGKECRSGGWAYH